MSAQEGQSGRAADIVGGPSLTLSRHEAGPVPVPWVTAHGGSLNYGLLRRQPSACGVAAAAPQGPKRKDHMVEKRNTNGTDFADIRELKTEELENVSGGAEPTCEVKVTFVGSAPVISVQCR
jgi:hypothetical protein